MVNERIRAAVVDSGMKQRAIAERIGVSENVFSQMLYGNRKISVDEFFQLCQVLQKTPDELYMYGQTQGAS